MTERQELLDAFARQAGCDMTEAQAIAGDASNRRYLRTTCRGRSVIIMDAPPEAGEDVGLFVEIAQWLSKSGLSAPDIIAADAEKGFLLLEDLGDALFARLLANDHDPVELYGAAIDVLLHLHDVPPSPSLPRLTADKMADLVTEVMPWYRAGFVGPDAPELGADFQTIITERFQRLEQGRQVFIHRDYHAENMIWLPERSSVRRVGLLDFQDAHIGPAVYDLTSVLKDARRDVGRDIENAMVQRFQVASGFGEDLRPLYHLMGLQRNLRILGIFARLCLRAGRPGYVDLIPRVWAHLIYDLDRIEDADLTQAITETLPSPDTKSLAALKARCPTRPAP